MPITHTNRKGTVYYLHQGITKTGKPRYYFAREPSERGIERIPDGYEITESVNGVVSLRRVTPQLISDLEVQAVKLAVQSHSHLRRYRVDVKKDAITIYEPVGGMIDEVMKKIWGGTIPDSTLERIRLENERYAQYTPVMRFLLMDAEKREFTVERMCYRGGMEGWLSLHRWGNIRSLGKQYIHHLGKESFFDLC